MYGIKNLLGISIDWLLTGDGTMYGANKLDIELFRTIRLQIALARDAVIENEPKAKLLIGMLRNDSARLSENKNSASAYLEKLSTQDIDLDLAIVLYTTYFQSGSKYEDRRNLLEAAIAYFETNKTTNKYESLKGNTKAKINIQANVGDNQINIMNNF